jgi:hypothetical protein
VEVYLPTADGDAVQFLFRPLDSVKDDFEKVVPEPKPPFIQAQDGSRVYEHNNTGYKEQLVKYRIQKTHWEFLQSISITKDLSFETVNMDDPNTYENWQKEVEEVFGRAASNYLFNKYFEANTLTDELLKKAKECFLAQREAQAKI